MLHIVKSPFKVALKYFLNIYKALDSNVKSLFGFHVILLANVLASPLIHL